MQILVQALVIGHSIVNQGNHIGMKITADGAVSRLAEFKLVR